MVTTMKETFTPNYGSIWDCSLDSSSPNGLASLVGNDQAEGKESSAFQGERASKAQILTVNNSPSVQ